MGRAPAGQAGWACFGMGGIDIAVLLSWVWLAPLLGGSDQDSTATSPSMSPQAPSCAVPAAGELAKGVVIGTSPNLPPFDQATR